MEKPTSLRGKIAQLVFVRIGSNMPPTTTVAEDYECVAKVVEDHRIGGLLLFNGGASDDCAATVQRLQKLTDFPLLVGADIERGSGQQITDHTLWPHALAFDALGAAAAEEVERFAFLSAQQARAVGIHVSFSPVADIHRNPRNPIIATRAFGTTAERVVELATAYVRGCHAAGLACCAKHFPGHGNTFEDSHDALPVVRETADELATTDLAPFRQLAGLGVEMFMTAHVCYPALDDSGRPATLSRPILTDLLRQRWEYPGLIVSDSLKMEGARLGETAPRTEAQLAVEAIRAGVDLLLDVTDVDQVIRQIERVCDDDEWLQQRVEAAFALAWELKQRVFGGPSEHGGVMGRQVSAAVAIKDAAVIKDAAGHARRVAEGALTVVTNNGRISTPLSGTAKVLALLVNPHGDGAYTRTDVLRQSLAAQDAVFATYEITGETPDQTDHLLALASGADCCLVAIVVKPAAWQTFGLPPAVQALIQSVTQMTPTAVASLGVPELLHDYPQAAIGLTTYSDVGVSQQALVDWYFG
jgi:beta-N-acetylhexosaminidase